VTFRVTWGGVQGADARRLLAVACRRGNIRGGDVGAIRVEATYSLLDVARDVAAAFEAQAGRPDPRDPRVRITRADAESSPRPGARERTPAPVDTRPPRPRPRVEEALVRQHVPHRAALPERLRHGGSRSAESGRPRRGGESAVRRSRKA
jgi:hypothetical protein